MDIHGINKNNLNLENLSDRLLRALDVLKTTQAELARKIEVKPQVINYLCKSKAKKSQLTYEIADALGINGEWLANGAGYMKSEDDPQHKLLSTQNRVPVITFDEVELFCKKNEQISTNDAVLDWLFTTADSGKNGFAIELKDKSMYPRFEVGTTAIINPDKKPKDKEFVLVYIYSIDDIIFRQLELGDEKIFLNPINTAMYKQIIFEENDKIIGTLVEIRWKI